MQRAANTITRTSFVLLCFTFLPACGLIEKLTGGEESHQDASAKPGFSPVEPVHFDKLVALLPQLEGWKASPSHGKFEQLGQYRVSRASATYEKPESEPTRSESVAQNRAKPDAPEHKGNDEETKSEEHKLRSQQDSQPAAISVEILDGSHVPAAYSQLAIMAHSRGPGEDMHKMSITVAGHSGIEEWDPTTGGVTAVIQVERRFLITLRGQGVSPEFVRETLQSIDLETLASFASKPKTRTQKN
jgi:hypothetical protein